MYKRDIYLDIDDKLNEHIKSVELDSNSRVWHFHLMVDYEPLDLTGKSVHFRAEKPDKTNVLNDCEIIDAENGIVKVELTRQVNAVPGHVNCLLKIVGSDGYVLKTKTFIVEVSKTLSDKPIVSTNEFSALDEALGRVQNIDQRFAETNAQLSESKKKLVYVNLKDFGVKGDGKTDDTAKIQEVLNEYDNIYIPTGEYIVSSPLVINKKNKIISDGDGIIKPTMTDDVIRIASENCEINVNIDGSLQKATNSSKAGIVVGFNGHNSQHIKLNGSYISNLKTSGIIWEQGSMCDFYQVRIYNCEGDGIICTDNYDDNNHGLFINTHIIHCNTGLRVSGDVDTNPDLPSRHHVFDNLKIYGCNKNLHIETITNYGSVFLESSTTPSEFTATSKGNKIQIIETRTEFDNFIDRGHGNVIEGYSAHGTWLVKNNIVKKNTLGDTYFIANQVTYQDADNHFVNEFELTQNSVTVEYAKGSAQKRTDYFRDRVKFNGGLVVNYASTGIFTIPKGTSISPNSTLIFDLGANDAGSGDTLICTLSNSEGYKYIVASSIGSSCYCVITNGDSYTKDLGNKTIRWVLLKHFA